MAFDAHKNLAIATVLTAPVPGSSGTVLVVGSGEGARFAAPPFNATVFPVNQPPTPVNAELVRVTARTGDSLTIVRSQEGSTARIIVAGDLIAATITAKTITDIESGANFPLITTPGTVTAPSHASAAATPITFAPAGTVRGTMFPSGGFSWGSTVDPGAGNLSVAGKVTAAIDQNAGVELLAAKNANAGAASFASISLAAGANMANGLYAFSDGYTPVGANQPNGVALYASFGPLAIAATAGQGSIRFMTGGQVERGRIHPGGGFSWGGLTDPGAGNLTIGNPGVGSLGIYLGAVPSYSPMALGVCTSGTALANMAVFQNAIGTVGTITTSASATGYNTTSDQRLKTDRGLITDPEVLRNTRIHRFTWNTDGAAGRGVFAQEAIAVLPSAVSIGSDERDEHGNLKQPWGVDYSKYVPDLIAGWQQHDATITDVLARVSRLEIAAAGLPPYRPHYGTTDPPPDNRGSSWFSRVRDVFRAWWARPSWV